MIRGIIIALLLIGGAGYLSSNYIGYSTAGKQYISKAREQRKSIRTGSGYLHTGYGSSRSYRGGK